MTNRDNRDPSPAHYSAVIIGGGFSGAVLAAHLAQQTDDAFSVLVLDRNPVRGRGVAYGTVCGGHLLNVPAGRMSAFEDDPEHFLRWANACYDPAVAPGSFLPRGVYGEYVEWVLRQAAERHPGKIEWKNDQAEAVSSTGRGARIQLRGGNFITADKVVLALGNFPPAASSLPEAVRKSRGYVPNPWAHGAMEGVGNEGSILLVGSGLTGVDMVVGLRDRGFRGTIHLLSRHGFLPCEHKPGQTWPAFWTPDAPRTARGLTRLIREQVRAAEQCGSGWRAVIDSLRGFTPAIWRSLPTKEKRRFLRHLRPYWEVHRHRVAPEIGRVVAQQAASGEIQAHCGRIVDCREDADKSEVIFRDRKTGEHASLMVDRVVNCTGPETDCRKLDDPLMRKLLGEGLARPDALCLGLDAAEDGALIDARGLASNVVYVVGPARKGRLWETTAVPEIRRQIAELTLLFAGERERGDVREAETLFAAD